jgi:uncharacterized protein (UPF0335 family)
MAEGQLAANQLRQFIERIERLEEERKGIANDIKDILSEAKSSGFEPKIIRQILKIRKMDDAERQEQEELLQVYLDALGE